MTPLKLNNLEKRFLIYEYFDHRWCRFIGHESIKFPFKKKNILIIDNFTTGNRKVKQFESDNITLKNIDNKNYKK